MSYNSRVLVKQVPDTANISGQVMKPDGTVNRSKLPTVFNPEDKVALELALQLRDRYGGAVRVLTMGPLKASELLRECLYMGADEAFLISDRKFAGADTLATSYVLAKAIQKIGGYDLIFAGRQAIDGDTAQVGHQTAEKLGLPQISYAEQILSAEGDQIRVRRKIDGGFEVLPSGPAFLLALLYIAYCLVRSHLKPALGPPVPRAERVTDKVELVREFLIGVVPLAALIGFTLGTILAGLATPTEAASCGAFGATALAAAYRKLSFKALKSAAISTMITSSMVLFLAVSSTVFGAVFTKLGATDLITNALYSVPLPDWGKLLLVMGLFVLGWPFEWPAIMTSRRWTARPAG